MRKLNKTFIFLSIIFSFFFCNFATNVAIAQNAANNTDEAKVKAFIQNVGDDIVRITSNKSLSKPQVELKMIELVDNIINPDWISRFVLGKYYRTISDKQKSRFSSLYRQYMINTYGPKFQHYEVTNFTLLDTENQNSFYLVKCEFMQKNSNTPVSVNFRVITKDKIAVIDVITEGISLIETQRSEFSSAIAQNGIDKFLSDLEQKVSNLRANTISNKLSSRKKFKS